MLKTITKEVDNLPNCLKILLQFTTDNGRLTLLEILILNIRKYPKKGNSNLTVTSRGFLALPISFYKDPPLDTWYILGDLGEAQAWVAENRGFECLCFFQWVINVCVREHFTLSRIASVQRKGRRGRRYPL
jgi:hypothetical protein